MLHQMNYQLLILLLTALMMVFPPVSSAMPTADSIGAACESENLPTLSGVKPQPLRTYDY